MMSDWPEDPPSTSSTVFVRSLPYDWTDLDLSAAFESIGPIRRAFVVTTKTAAKESRGFGFVEFALPDDARRAVLELNGKEEQGRKLKVEIAEKGKGGKGEAGKRKGEGKEQRGEKRQKAELKVEKKEEAVKEETPTLEMDSETSEEEESEDEEEQEEDQEDEEELASPLPPPPKAKRPTPSPSSSSSSSSSILLSGLPLSTTSLTSLLTSHHLSPSHIIFPSPESTPKYKAARLTFPSPSLASSALSSLSSASLRAIPLPLSSLRLIIRNLPFHISSSQLQKQMEKFGSLEECRVVEGERGKGLSKGFGFVRYGRMEDGERMMKEVSGGKLWGRTVAVDWALDKKDYAARVDMMKVQEEKPVKEEDAEMKEEEKAKEEEEEEEDKSLGDDEKSSDDEISPPPQPSPRPAASSPDTDDACTLFIRNLSYDTTEDALFAKFSLFGRVKYAKIVMETIGGNEEKTDDEGEVIKRSKGVAFVRYFHKADADRVLSMSSPAPSTTSRPSLVSHSESSIILDGRALSIVLAVSRQAASALHKAAEKVDKRNLYLAKEGVILSTSEAAGELGEEEVKRRERYWREKKKKLENPNFMVSRVRLSVRNLPLEMGEKELKAIFVKAVREGLKEEGRRDRAERKRQEEEEKAAIERGEAIDEERRRVRREGFEARDAKRAIPIVVKQVKVVRDKDRPGVGGVGRSKRYGFIEFSEHEHAMQGLRYVNNRKEVWGGVKGGRPIVEFAVDDVRKVKEREERQKRWEKMREIKAKQIANKEEEEANEEGKDPGVMTQKEKKKQARALGVCYKCGGAGHQAKKCKVKSVKTEGEKQQMAEAEVKEEVDEEIAGKGKRKVEVEGKLKVKKAKVAPLPASPVVVAVVNKGKKRKDRQGEEEGLSKREKKELEGEAKFDSMVAAYKRKFFEAAGAEAVEGKKRMTSRWFDV